MNIEIQVTNPADVPLVSSAVIAETRVHQELAGRTRRSAVVIGTQLVDRSIALAMAQGFLRDVADEDVSYDAMDLTVHCIRDEHTGAFRSPLPVLVDRGRDESEDDEEDCLPAWCDEDGKCREGYDELRVFGARLDSDINRVIRNPAFLSHLPPETKPRRRFFASRNTPRTQKQTPAPVVAEVPVPQSCEDVTTAPETKPRKMVNIAPSGEIILTSTVPVAGTVSLAASFPVLTSTMAHHPVVHELAKAHGSTIEVIARAIASSGLTVTDFAGKHPTVRRDFVRAAKRAA